MVILSEYNLILILNPMMVFANVIGSVVNVVISQGVVMIILMTVIFAGILINIKNARKKFREENKRLEREKTEKLLNSFHDNEPQGNNEPSPGNGSSGEDVNLFDKICEKSQTSLDIIKENISSDSPSVAIEKEEVKVIKRYEGRNFNPKKMFIFAATIALTIVYSLLKGTSSIRSVLDYQNCSWQQIPLFLGFVVFIAAIQIYSIQLVKREQFLKIKYSLQCEHEVKLSNRKITFLILFGLVVGFVANLLGLGGGFVIFPMLVWIEVSPLVASATTMFMIFLSKIVAALLAIFSQYFKFDYSLFVSALVIISVVVFSLLSDYILKK